MAQSKSSTAKNNNSKKKAATKNSAAPVGVPSYRREIWALVFLFLAVFMGISFFNTDGAFIAFFADLTKGLIGWGYWAFAPMLLFISIVLFFHRNKPVALRITSMLFIPLVFASIAHCLFGDKTIGTLEIKLMVGALFEQGQVLKSGGVLGGLIGVALNSALSIYGALPVLAAFLVLFFAIGFRGGFAGLFGLERKPKTKPQKKEQYYEELPLDIKPKKPIKQKELKKPEPLPIKNFAMDIPLNDEEEILPLNGGNLYDLPLETETKPARGRSKKALAAPTRNVKPLSIEEAADISGVDLDLPVIDVSAPAKRSASRKSVTVSGEISDPPKAKKISREEVDAEAQAVAAAIKVSQDAPDYDFPPTKLLNSPPSTSVDARDEIAINKERLAGAIHSFGINASIVDVTHGPTVTRYDIELEQGVKLARVTNLAGDLALALGVSNVRIAPIPDKISTVGIEVPNRFVSMVYLREIIESSQFTAARSKLSFALGKDIGGTCVVGNISKLPHLLIAGTTGSGKSVCMNSLILSLLYKASPEEVRLIMIDPKMVELGVYNGIPHLYVPVVTDPKKAAGALQWSVVEMLKRYRLFSEIGVRDLASYNKYCSNNGEQTLPQIVIVIDELADLMLVASKEVEESICRVAQMGRAAGMHLVIATQRPSTDVITGLMKANIPSRIAFAVSSALESRIILDQSGAEKLIGMGDMLYAPIGSGKPTRIQGAFVSDEEREEVIKFIKRSAGEVQQNREIEDFMNKVVEDKNAEHGKSSKDDSAGGAYDDMLPQAVETVLETGSCSVSMLQRRVKLGYSRAARIVDQMEELGIVGPYEGAKPRAVIIDRTGWNEIKVQLGLASDDMEIAAEMNDL